MKKSYSKIRHIQESNIILEQRKFGLLNEQLTEFEPNGEFSILESQLKSLTKKIMDKYGKTLSSWCNSDTDNKITLPYDEDVKKYQESYNKMIQINPNWKKVKSLKVDGLIGTEMKTSFCKKIRTPQ